MAASGSGSGSGSAADFYEDVDEEYRVRDRMPNPDGDDRYNEQVLEILFKAEKKLEQKLLEDRIIAERTVAIDWIIKMRSQHKFKFHTAYLTVTYIDRFLSKKQSIDRIPPDEFFPALSWACLSLAAKLEESGKLDLSKFTFQTSSVEIIEKDVSFTLEKNLESATPFDFIRFFVSKFLKEGPKKDVVVTTVEAIFSTIKDRNFMVQYLPSVIAMAATLVAMDRTLTRESLEIRVKEFSLNQSVDTDHVYACYSSILLLQRVE